MVLKKPYRLNERTKSAILQSLLAGSTIDAAAWAASVNPTTLYAWLRAGKSDDATEELRQLHEDVEAAIAKSEVHLVAIVRSHAKKNWKPAAWLLERRNPSAWGRRDPNQERVAEENTKALRELFQLFVGRGMFTGAIDLGDTPRDGQEPETDDLSVDPESPA